MEHLSKSVKSSARRDDNTEPIPVPVLESENVISQNWSWAGVETRRQIPERCDAKGKGIVQTTNSAIG